MIKFDIYTQKLSWDKGHKIAAAVFLVTAHLPEHDPMRIKLRELGTSLIGSHIEGRSGICRAIENHLTVAGMAGLIGDRNIKIIVTEIRYALESQLAEDARLTSLFPPLTQETQLELIKRTSIKDTNTTQKDNKNVLYKREVTSKEDKNKRLEQIVSFIVTRKSANIKDISLLFPEVSEKTIQRELGHLVVAGKIVKRGNKRWSLYLPA